MRQKISRTITAQLHVCFSLFSRGKRETENIVFKKKDVVILSQERSKKTHKIIAEIFVLDATATSLVPDKALSAKDLEVILNTISANLTIQINVISRAIKTIPSNDNEKSNVPIIVGTIFGVLVLFCLLVSVFVYMRNRRQQR